ncbi:MAG: tetratricopeptide repeat protein [Bacteroidetes bacterium]|nr:tetratricopeptide repeat protein [Bacteroidota bacterium]
MKQINKFPFIVLVMFFGFSVVHTTAAAQTKAKPKALSIKKANPKEQAQIKAWEEKITAAGDNETYDTVEVYAAKILSKQPNNTTATYELGNAFRMQNKLLDSAKALFELTIKNDPKHFRAYGDLASMLASERKYEEAISYAKKGIEAGTTKQRDLAVSNKNLGGYYYQVKKYTDAIEVLKKAVALDPNYGSAYHDLSVAYRQLDKDAEAAEAAENSLANSPDDASYNVPLYEYLSWYYYDNKVNRSKGLSYAEKGLKLDPYNERFIGVKAEDYQSKGYWSSFVDLFKRLANHDRQNGDAAYSVAYGYQKLGNNSEALNWLKIAARRGNDNARQILRSMKQSW